jgi:ABC-type lipoprotein export system ATPase subunit
MARTIDRTSGESAAADLRGDGAPVIRLENVSRAYPGRISVEALSGIDLVVEAGEFLAIMGPSGSGKSTLLHIMGCLDRPTSGHYLFRGREVSSLPDRDLAHIRNREIGFVFQAFNLLPEETALENVALPLVYSGVNGKRKKAREALEQVGLGKRMTHRPGELSGGEQQRVAIARALVKRPSVLLADEPTGNLDTESGENVLASLGRLRDEGLTVVVITHDPEVASRAGRIVQLRDGSLVGDA